MRIFNPFKPHICEFITGGYAVRKFSIIYMGWRYLDKDTKGFHNQWWGKSNARYTLCTTPIDAIDLLREHYVIINKPKKFSKLYAY